MSNIAKRISAVALSVVLALGMCPAVAFAAPAASAADAQEPQAVEAPAGEAVEAAAPEAVEAATPEAAAPETTPAAEEPVTLEATASQDGPELAADAAGKVKISKTMTAYSVMDGKRTLVTSTSGAANQARDCGDAGYCQLVSPHDGSAATTYPKVGALEAFTLGSQNGYKLAAFNVTYTDKATGKQVKWTNGNGLTRLGAFNAAKTTYEFTVPDADDITVNAVWEKQVTSIAKLLKGRFGFTSASSCDGGTCEMVATQSGIPATKYPTVGNKTAFKITTKPGYTLHRFNVSYTGDDGLNHVMTNGYGLTRVGAYSATTNIYEFTVPDASDVTVNVIWRLTDTPALKASGTCDDGVYWELFADGLLELRGHQGPMADLAQNESHDRPYIIAARDLRCPIKHVFVGGVTHIGNYAFAGLSDLETVSLYKDDVTSIGEFAFANTPITSIEIPASVKTIGDRAFTLTNLTSVTIPSGVESIGSQAFYGCKSLKTVKINEGLEALENSVFYNCPSLTSVTLPKSLKRITGNAFSGCKSLASINIPAGVETIEPTVFVGCSGLKSFTVDKANTSISSPDGRCLIMKYGPIGNVAYRDEYGSNVLCAYAAASGTSYVVPSGVEVIGQATFTDATTLKTVTIPTSVKSIVNYAFSGCSSLVTANVPKALFVTPNVFPSTCAIVRY